MVLADIGMPRKGGYDVSAFVKGRADLAHIPVLLLAGAFEPVDQARAEQVRADGVLIKPFEPRQVIERVKELLAAVPRRGCRAPGPRAGAGRPRAGADRGAGRRSDRLGGGRGGGVARRAVRKLEPGPARAGPGCARRAAGAAARSGSRCPKPNSNRHSSPSRSSWNHPCAFEPLAAPASNGATLDDYFDRLSAAFEHATAPSARQFQPLPERLEDLMPPAPPAPASPPPVAVAAPPPATEWPAQEWLSPAGTTLSFDRRGDEANPILEAVTALIGARRRERIPEGRGTAVARTADCAGAGTGRGLGGDGGRGHRARARPPGSRTGRAPAAAGAAGDRARAARRALTRGPRLRAAPVFDRRLQ